VCRSYRRIRLEASHFQCRGIDPVAGTRCRSHSCPGPWYIGCVRLDRRGELGDVQISVSMVVRASALEGWEYSGSPGTAQAREAEGLVLQPWLGNQCRSRILEVKTCEYLKWIGICQRALTISFAPVRSFFPAGGRLRDFRLRLLGLFGRLLVALASRSCSLSSCTVGHLRLGLIIGRRLGRWKALL
jgi:hypothetical protein